MRLDKTIDIYKIVTGDFTIWFDAVEIDEGCDLVTLKQNGRLSSNLWDKTAVEFKKLWGEIK
jgi:hypothetical protein